MPIYLALDIGSLLIPLLFSFHPKLKFYKEWRVYVPAILISMFFYISWDIWFTDQGIWGFNPDYLVGIDLCQLPIEEWLFFFCIPYACLFTHHCLKILVPNWSLSVKVTSYLTYGLILTWVALILLFSDRLYTVVNFLWAIPLTVFALRYHIATLQKFFITYLVIAIPFIFVNGVLTGALNPEPIVWYNDTENIGLRFFMPIEDYTYAFTMLLFPLLIAQRFNKTSFL